MKFFRTLCLYLGLVSCSIGCQHVRTPSEPKIVGGVAYDQLDVERQVAMYPVFRLSMGSGTTCTVTLVAPLTFLGARHCIIAVTKGNVLPETPETEELRPLLTLSQFLRAPVEFRPKEPAVLLERDKYSLAAPPVVEVVRPELKKPDILLLRIDEQFLATQAPDFLTLLQNTPPAKISSFPEKSPLYAAGYGLKGEGTGFFDRSFTMGMVSIYSIDADIINTVWVNEEFVKTMSEKELFDEATRELLTRAHTSGSVGLEVGDSGGPLFSLVETSEGLRMRLHAVNYAVGRTEGSSGRVAVRIGYSERLDGRSKAWLESEGLTVLSE